jgi:hypothetical protein
VKRWLLAVVVATGCTSIAPARINGDAGPEPILGPAPSYASLFTNYFAAGTHGHCADAGCHNDPKHHVWICGTTPASCYQGMVGATLISRTDPTHSLIADPENSPLSWVNPIGPMPFDAPGPFPEARQAILAWVAAGAPND